MSTTLVAPSSHPPDPGTKSRSRRHAAGRSAARLLVRRSLFGHGVLPLLVLVDLSCLALAALVPGRTLVTCLVLWAVVVPLNAGASLYRSKLTLSLLDDAPALVARGVVGAALAVAIGIWANLEFADRRVLEATAVYLMLVLAARAGAYAMVRALRRRRLVAHRTLILGAGHVGNQLAELMQQHPEYGLTPVGFVDDDPLLAPQARAVPVLGRMETLAETIRRYQITQVVVAFGPTKEAQLIDILRTCDRLSCEIFFVPRLFEVACVSRDMDELWGIPLVRLRRAPFRTPSWRLKRAADILLAGSALLLLAPLLVACAAAVRSEGGPGVLFRQRRYGLDGEPFDILKFRSLRATPEESATRWSVSGEAEMGPVGRLLRRSSLDELPQLWNVVRGDMSLVGPRPERPHFVTEFSARYPRYDARHRVPTGLTGWAQIHGLRGDTSIADRARFDNRYVENWTLWSDAKILLRTIGAVVRRPGS